MSIPATTTLYDWLLREYVSDFCRAEAKRLIKEGLKGDSLAEALAARIISDMPREPLPAEPAE